MNVKATRVILCLILSVSTLSATDLASRYSPPAAAPDSIRPAAPGIPAPLRTIDPAAVAAEPELMALFRDLFIRSGNGTREDERAAFIVKEKDGGWSCLLWPSTAAYRSAEFTGPIPEGTVAIAHTHPNAIVKASRQDRDAASSSQLPLFTLTWANITLVDPVSREEQWVIRRKAWLRAVPASLSRECECRELGTPRRAPDVGGLLASGR